MDLLHVEPGWVDRLVSSVKASGRLLANLRAARLSDRSSLSCCVRLTATIVLPKAEHSAARCDL